MTNETLPKAKKGDLVREILFRGKRRCGGGWVYGMPVANIEGVITHITYCEKKFFEELCDVLIHEVAEAITSETVGQYTGLRDKNGVRIFEGDIVKAWSEGAKAVGVIKQRIDGMWLIYPAWQDGQSWGLCPTSDGKTTVEVIGDIHDNPELLEV